MAETVIKIISFHWKDWSSNTWTTWCGVNSLEKTLMLRMIEGRRRRGWQDEMVGWHHWLSGHEFDLCKDREAWHTAVHGVAESQTQLSNRTTAIGTLWDLSSSRGPVMLPKDPVLVISYLASSVCRQLCAQVRAPQLLWLQIGCWSSRLHRQRRRKKSDLLHGFKNQKTLPQSTLQTVVSSELSGRSCSTCSYLNQSPGGGLGLHDWLAP